ncbi:uncharacterized protein LY79DRAFT_543408 [Colletotrichum navitas]|uniref:Uncharacterized protein n=1 Tax=Colletotrichum navitas TaxID=681940 RepID=A0AAD8Q7A9_9PEZI|nr:uncharacterized protein LY79DRAFT_543408 [Colletotrichum navitas]KAK1596994.1 hypothetical protein LY79DRAFT_543408 [Colletotrichum navitas]
MRKQRTIHHSWVQMSPFLSLFRCTEFGTDGGVPPTKSVDVVLAPLLVSHHLIHATDLV